MPSKRSPLRPSHSSRAFTLIELLVVIGILLLLGAVAFVTAQKVHGGGKERLTRDAIHVLETIAGSYQADVGKIPARYTEPGPLRRQFPIIDARVIAPGNDPVPGNTEPSLQLFLLAARETAAVDEHLKALESRLVKRSQIASKLYGGDSPREEDNDRIEAVTILDGFGNPIRFVHPNFDGGYGQYFDADGGAGDPRPLRDVELKRATGPVAPVPQFSRSIRPLAGAAYIGDADEGKCRGNQPYFYSAGSDGNPGTREDNVYTNKPEFPAETLNEG